MMNGGYMSNFMNGGYNGNGMQQGFNSFNMMGGSNIMPMIGVGLILLMIYFIFKDKKKQGSALSLNKETFSVINAEEVAKLRYARGEISHEEFQSILEIIKA
jgi:putative membrane protein